MFCFRLSQLTTGEIKHFLAAVEKYELVDNVEDFSFYGQNPLALYKMRY